MAGKQTPSLDRELADLILDRDRWKEAAEKLANAEAEKWKLQRQVRRFRKMLRRMRTMMAAALRASREIRS